ncbi:hypothetical protein BDV93DRAFT_526620 [Ceratobasidium sp. AG-I]|nr:hypothetical protein BDV93DRAFT_526620 [Ceratobasidium sp. AG-I]
MPTVVSSRALVPIGRRIPNAPEDSDASKAIVLRRKQAGEENEDLTKALIIRPSDDGKDDRQALVLYRKKGGPEALRELAEWHKSSTLLPPFRLEELLRVSESQFLSCLSTLQNLQDPLYFHDDILDTIKATREYAVFKEKGGDDPLQNQAFVTQTISSRIHNAYFRTASWKYVRDHAKLLKDMELEDLNVYAQLKSKPALCIAYLETYEMLRQIEASGQHEVGLLASASPHYMKHFKDNGGILEWDSEAGLRLNKSLVDTIIIELILPQSRYPASILMLCLRDAIAGGDHKTSQRFTQDVFDAIGDLSVTLQLLDMMDTPISASDARAWRLAQSENINASFTALIKSSQGASNHVAGIGQHVVPLTKTKTPATLEKIWDSINQTYVARAGMDIDILWGLEDSMNPEPQWSAWALTRKDSKDEAPDARALVRKGKGTGEGRKKKPLAIAAEPTSDGEIPLLIEESDYEDEDEEDTDTDGWSDDDDEEADPEEVEWYRQQFDAMRREQEEGKKAEAPAPARSPEGRGNPFKTLFRSLKGRFLSKNPILSVDPEAPRAEFDERDEEQDQTGKKKKKKKPKKKAGGAAGGEEELPSLLPAYPVKGVAPDLPPLIPVSVAAERLKARNAGATSASEPKVLVKKNNVVLEEGDDVDAHKPEGSGKKKKKKKKKAKKAGEAAEDDDEEDEPAPMSPVTPAASAAAKSPPPVRSTPKSPQATKATPTSPSMGAASASASSLYTPQPETAQSGLSYMKSEGIGMKTKTKSRPEPGEGRFAKLGTFMTRTFRGKEKEEKEKEEKAKEKEDEPKSGVAERLREFMKSVTGGNSRAASSWERILGLDDTKGQSGLDWNAFVKAMTDLGFEYDESSAGSRVRFDPPNRNDKSYTTHKPHPDPWLHPKRVKAIARDLYKMYGFEADTLLGHTEAVA